MLPQSEADDFAYTACYCEENVYKLCERLLVQPGEVYAVFVSNRDKQVGGYLLVLPLISGGDNVERVSLLVRYHSGVREPGITPPTSPCGTTTSL